MARLASDAIRMVVTLTRKLEALREQKKGLMQQLLTGRVRVTGVAAASPPEGPTRDCRGKAGISGAFGRGTTSN